MTSVFIDFVTTELPRRSAHLTVEDSGYDGDPNAGGAPDVLKYAPKGTWYMRQTPDIVWYRKEIGGLPGATSWVVPGGSPGTLTVEAQKGSAGTITAGQAVYLSGWDATDEVAEVEPADASAAGTMPAIGIAESTIELATTGTVVIAGALGNINTSGYPQNALLYVGETAGTLTATPPTGTALVQRIAQVMRVDGSAGIVLVSGAGTNDLPNLATGSVWVGDGSGVPAAQSPDGIDGTAIHDNVAGEITTVAEKTTPAASDVLLIEDSAAADTKKRLQVGNLPSTDDDAIHDNVAGEITAVAEKTTPAASDVLLIEDSAAADAKKRLQVGNLPPDADAIHDNVAAEISAVAEKVAPLDSDLLLIEDTASGNTKKRLQIGNLPGGTDDDAIHDNVAAEIATIAEKTTPVAGDLILIEDSADSNAKKRLQLGNLPPGGLLGAGWVYVTDATTQGAGTVTSKVWQDGPGNTVLQSFTSSSADLRLTIQSSYPTVDVDGTPATLTRDATGAFYAGDVDITVGGSGDIVAKVFTGDDIEGDSDTTAVTLELPPVITALSFTGSYPGSQTELKAGDTFQLTGTTDKPIDLVEIQNYQALQFASIGASGTAFTVGGTIADRGDTAVSRPGRVRVRDATTGAFSSTRDTNQGGGSTDGVDVVLCNDLRPSVGFGAATYPGAQQALKASETATVINAVNFYDTLVYDSPTSELSIASPSTFQSPKTVQRIAGSYNVSTNNLRITANRAANDATTIVGTVVGIANAAVVITVSTPAARLRSGGNDGTSVAQHVITMTGNQQLLNAPSMDEGTGNAGTFIGSWSGGGTTWTRTLQVHDNDDKGTKSWQNLVATNLAGIVTNTVTTGPNYTLGGFVARSLTFASFSQSVPLNVAVVTYAKLSAGVFTATNQPAQLNPVQGDVSDIIDTYTILSPLATNPQTLWWNDVAAASSNSSGTAQITNVEEAV